MGKPVIQSASLITKGTIALEVLRTKSHTGSVTHTHTKETNKNRVHTYLILIVPRGVDRVASPWYTTLLKTLTC